MQRNVGVAAAQSRQQWSHQSGKSDQWITAERAEQQIEPNHIRLKSMQRLQQTESTTRVIERPATQNSKSCGLCMGLWQFVGQNGQAEKRIPLQLLGQVQSVFAQSSRAWGKGGYQTDLHSPPALQALGFDVHSDEDVGTQRPERKKIR